MILAERTGRLEAEAKLANARAEAALIAYYKLEIEKLKRQLYGTRSERKARLLEQMELQLEELETTATEEELAAEKAAARTLAPLLVIASEEPRSRVDRGRDPAEKRRVAFTCAVPASLRQPGRPHGARSFAPPSRDGFAFSRVARRWL